MQLRGLTTITGVERNVIKETGHRFPALFENKQKGEGGPHQSPPLWVSPWTPVREGDTADPLSASLDKWLRLCDRAAHKSSSMWIQEQRLFFAAATYLPTEAPSVNGRRSRSRRLDRLPQAEALVAELVISGAAPQQGADKLSSPLLEFNGEGSSWGIPCT